MIIVQLLLAGLLIGASPVEHSDQLTIKSGEETLAVVERKEFTNEIPDTRLLDVERYNRFIHRLSKEVYHAPRNARLTDQGTILPGESGYQLDKSMFRHLFLTYFYGRGAAEWGVPTMKLYPKVDSELLSDIRVRQIGQYVTYFNIRNENRVHNITLAADALDNHVIFPGEVFSFNKIVGKRTKDKGYLPAPIIVKGELSEGIGGGICQVSSTLFNAVDRAGLKIIERYSHSKSVPYVPPGRDATVSWYGPDFRFQNRYNQPILIRAKRYGGSMVVKLYSSEMINFETNKVPHAPTGLPEETGV